MSNRAALFVGGIVVLSWGGAGGIFSSGVFPSGVFSSGNLSSGNLSSGISAGGNAAAASEPVALFNGHNLDGWRAAGGAIGPAWEVVDGQLHLNRSLGRGGHLLSQRAFGDFDLQFQWRVAAKGNGGIKYRVQKYGGALLGCEFQLLDDAGHRNGRNPLTSAGALYGLFAPRDEKKLMPIDEYNDARIVVQGQRLEHWLNGQKILEVEVGSPEWRRQIQRSKFNDKPGFGENREGLIMLQDHGSELWLRNMVLRPLPAVKSSQQPVETPSTRSSQEPSKESSKEPSKEPSKESSESSSERSSVTN